MTPFIYIFCFRIVPRIANLSGLVNLIIIHGDKKLENVIFFDIR